MESLTTAAAQDCAEARNRHPMATTAEVFRTSDALFVLVDLLAESFIADFVANATVANDNCAPSPKA